MRQLILLIATSAEGQPKAYSFMYVLQKLNNPIPYLGPVELPDKINVRGQVKQDCCNEITDSVYLLQFMLGMR